MKGQRDEEGMEEEGLGLGCAKKELEKLRVYASYEELMLSLSAETM